MFICRREAVAEQGDETAGSVEEDGAVGGAYLAFNVAFGVVSPSYPYEQAGETQAGQAGDEVHAKLTGQPCRGPLATACSWWSSSFGAEADT